MKVVTCLELAKMPVGTIFSCWEPAYSTGLYVLESHSSSLENDFFYAELLPQPEPGLGNLEPVFPTWSSRWGNYDDNETFAVYESSDIEAMLSVFQEALAVAK